MVNGMTTSGFLEAVAERGGHDFGLSNEPWMAGAGADPITANPGLAGSPQPFTRTSPHSPKTPGLDHVFPSKLSTGGGDFAALDPLFGEYSPPFDAPLFSQYPLPPASNRASTSLSEGYDLPSAAPSPTLYGQSQPVTGALWPSHIAPAFLPTPPMPVDQYSSEDDSTKAASVESGKTKPAKRPRTQLRTASRAPKKRTANTVHRPAETQEEVRARAAHNQVEQQYRKRLNAHFEKLLTVLPPVEGAGGARDGIGERRVSKAEVLDLAMQRIKALEKENRALDRERRGLRGRMHRLEGNLGRGM